MRPVGEVRQVRRHTACGGKALGILGLIAGIAVGLSACSTVLTGTPASAPAASSPAGVDSRDLAALLIAPEDFPDGYTAQVLDYREAVLAAEDLGGASRGARINPVRCQPSATPLGEDDLAMISGMGGSDQSTLAVVLTRTDEDLSAARDLVDRCTDVVSDQYGVQSRITRALLAPPATGTAGEFAYSQNVSSGSGEVVLSQESITLMGQVGNVRIAVTGMTQRGTEVGRADLDQLFAAAVAPWTGTGRISTSNSGNRRASTLRTSRTTWQMASHERSSVETTAP